MTAQTSFDEILFLDRLHQTFLLLNQVVIPAYLEHFSGEPEKRAVVQYYAERLAEAMRGETSSNSLGPASAPADRPLDLAADHDVWMRAAIDQLRKGSHDAAEHHLSVLGTQPHAELRRVDETRQANTARCVLYDPQLLWAHRRLRELKSSRSAPADPANLAQSLQQAHAAIRSLREQAGERDLSLRKFLDKHRQTVWKLAWLYRCRGMELDNDPAAARSCFLRAWAIGDALFPVSERGRLERFDPIFLAELGDVYARLSRFDLMLRYIYYEEGLPARYELAKPVAELARAAESVRLVRTDETTVAYLDQELPETVSQILFDEPVVAQAGGGPREFTRYAQSSRSVNWGWFLVLIGSCLVGTAIAWGVVRVARRSQRRATSEL